MIILNINQVRESCITHGMVILSIIVTINMLEATAV